MPRDCYLHGPRWCEVRAPAACGPSEGDIEDGPVKDRLVIASQPNRKAGPKEKQPQRAMMSPRRPVSGQSQRVEHGRRIACPGIGEVGSRRCAASAEQNRAI